MVLDSVARIVKVQLPAYLKQLPVPESITGFARLTANPKKFGYLFSIPKQITSIKNILSRNRFCTYTSCMK
ncbi:hypothetical protein STEG23_005431 [Scotinomys teguina]